MTTAAAATPPPAVQAPRVREDLVHPDPLLDSLVEICRLHGVAASRAALSAALPLADGRLGLEMAERAAARVGMAAKLQRLALSAIDTATLPAVLILKDNKACVLTELDARRGQASVLLPDTGQGAVRLRHCSTPPPSISTLAVPNTQSLCSLSHTICGTAATSPDSAAPAPSITSSAGRAQQTSVPELASSDSQARSADCRDSLRPSSASASGIMTPPPEGLFIWTSSRREWPPPSGAPAARP